MKLAAALQRDNNNLDLFRLIAACMVIYGHAFALAPGGSTQDFVGSTLGFDYSGSLAVKIFFFLSGLVVTNSLIEKGDPLRFVIARVFRIWPAFLVVVTASALILGPLMSNLPPSDYFGHPDTFRYIRRNALMNIQFMLPGVFEDNPYKGAVNGSLWSIPLEVGAYIVLLGLFMLGVLKSRLLALGIFLLIALDPLVGNRLLFTWLGEPELKLLPPLLRLRRDPGLVQGPHPGRRPGHPRRLAAVLPVPPLRPQLLLLLRRALPQHRPPCDHDHRPAATPEGRHLLRRLPMGLPGPAGHGPPFCRPWRGRQPIAVAGGHAAARPRLVAPRRKALHRPGRHADPTLGELSGLSRPPPAPRATLA